MVHDLEAYKRAKNKLKQYEPHYKKLCEISDYLFNNLHLYCNFDILEQVESQKIAYYIEINECKRIINSAAARNQFKLKIIRGNDSEEKK